MKQKFYNLKINTNGQKLYDFTEKTCLWLKENNFNEGILNLSIMHTSASIIIQENFILIQLRAKMICQRI